MRPPSTTFCGGEGHAANADARATSTDAKNEGRSQPEADGEEEMDTGEDPMPGDGALPGKERAQLSCRKSRWRVLTFPSQVIFSWGSGETQVGDDVIARKGHVEQMLYERFDFLSAERSRARNSIPLPSIRTATLSMLRPSVWSDCCGGMYGSFVFTAIWHKR